MNIEIVSRHKKMRQLWENLRAVEENRFQGNQGNSLETVNTYLQTIIKDTPYPKDK